MTEEQVFTNLKQNNQNLVIQENLNDRMSFV